MKRGTAALLAALLLMLGSLPARAAEGAMSLSQGYESVYGIRFPIAPSPRTDSYTFTVYEGEAAVPSALQVQKTLTISGAQTVFLPFSYDLTQPKNYLLTVTANVLPQRRGLDTPFTREYPFQSKATCGHEGEPGAFLAGDGSEADPFRVSTPQQLDHVRQHSSSHFLQVAHIDLSSWPTDWTPIPTFSGTYDGDGYTISHIPCQEEKGFGLFRAINGATIRRLGFTDVTFSSPKGIQLGVIATSTTSSLISECFLRDSSIGGVDNNNGAMAGNIYTTTFERCYAAHLTTEGRHVGSFAGQSTSVILKECFAIPDKISYYSYGRGTLVGWDGNGGAKFTNCYYSNDTAPGVTKGAVGWYMRSTTYNYDPAGTAGLPLSSFSSLGNLSGFSEDYWEVKPGAEYPTLRCERPLGTPAKTNAVQTALPAAAGAVSPLAR